MEHHHDHNEIRFATVSEDSQLLKQAGINQEINSLLYSQSANRVVIYDKRNNSLDVFEPDT